MMQNDTPTGTPADDQYAQEGQDGGYCIKIYVGTDNQVQSVTVQHQQDGGGEDHEMPQQGNDVQSIDQALQVVRSIYESGGQEAAPSEQDREAIARKVFGDDIVNKQMPGELNRKPGGGRY